MALLAYTSAKSDECKTKIHELLCKSLEHEKALQTDYSVDLLYKSILKRKCPHANNEKVNSDSKFETRIKSKFFKGCLFQEDLDNYIDNFDDTSIFEEFDKNTYLFKISESKKNVSNLQLCIDICLARNKYAAYNYPSKNCICLAIINHELEKEIFAQKKCLQLAKKHYNSQIYEIYETGFLGKFYM